MNELKKYGYKKYPLPYIGEVYIIVFDKRVMFELTLAKKLGMTTSNFHQKLINKFNGKLFITRNKGENRIYFRDEAGVQAAVEWLDALYLARKMSELIVNPIPTVHGLINMADKIKLS